MLSCVSVADSFGGPYLDSELDAERLNQMILEEDHLPR